MKLHINVIATGILLLFIQSATAQVRMAPGAADAGGLVSLPGECRCTCDFNGQIVWTTTDEDVTSREVCEGNSRDNCFPDDEGTDTGTLYCTWAIPNPRGSDIAGLAGVEDRGEFDVIFSNQL